MTPSRVGQIARFHTPFEDEDPDQLYVILEIKGNDETTRVDIRALHSGLEFSSITTVKLQDLVVVELPTSELIGQVVTIIRSDKNFIKGKVIDVKEKTIDLNLKKIKNGVNTNVNLTVIDSRGGKHDGELFLN